MAEPYVPVARVAHVTLVLSRAGETVTVGTDFRLDVEWTPITLTDLANSAAAEWLVNLRPNMDVTTMLVKTNARSLLSEDAPSVDVFTNSGMFGTLAGSGLPNNVSAVIKFSTAQRGRSFRGRVYYPSRVLTEMATGDTWATAAITAMGVAWNGYIAGIDADFTTPEIEHVVVSRFHDGARREVGVATPVTGLSVNPNICTQRRRTGGS